MLYICITQFTLAVVLWRGLESCFPSLIMDLGYRAAAIAAQIESRSVINASVQSFTKMTHIVPSLISSSAAKLPRFVVREKYAIELPLCTHTEAYAECRICPEILTIALNTLHAETVKVCRGCPFPLPPHQSLPTRLAHAHVTPGCC